MQACLWWLRNSPFLQSWFGIHVYVKEEDVVKKKGKRQSTVLKFCMKSFNIFLLDATKICLKLAL